MVVDGAKFEEDCIVTEDIIIENYLVIVWYRANLADFSICCREYKIIIK